MNNLIILITAALLVACSSQHKTCADSINAMWPQPVVHVYIEDGFTDADREAAVRAVNQWNQAFGQQFFVLGTMMQANIVIHNMDSTFPPGQDAYTKTQYTTAGYILSSEMFYNSDKVLKYNVDAESVFIHELGHALGLQHVDDKNDIMYFDLEGGVERRNVRASNVNTLKCLGYSL